MSEMADNPAVEDPTIASTDCTEAAVGTERHEAGNAPQSCSTFSYENESAALDDLGQELKRTAERNPNEFFAQTAYARYQADIGGDARIAVFYFNKALKLVDVKQQPEMVNSYVTTIGCLAEALEGMKLYDKAEQSYAAALRLKPDDAHCLGSYAVYLHRIKKDYTAAEAMYKKAATLHPMHASVLTKYANFLKNVTNNMLEAERYYRKAVEAAPTNADCLGSYAVFLHGQKKDEKQAQEYYQQALEADPTHVNILSNYGLYLAEVRKDLAGAKAVYERALALDPHHSNCLYNYAVLYDSSFRIPERAEQLYRRALKHNPRHAYALYNLAILLEEKAAEAGDLSYVRTLFEKAVAAAPGDAMTLADFGRFVFVRERNHTLAEEVLERALAVDPDYAAALFYMGMVLLNGKSQPHEAERHFRRCLANNPTHGGANQYLARILAQDKRRRQNAAEYYQKALDASPTSVEMLLEFSRHLAESRRNVDKEKARELYRRACELSQTAGRVGRPSRLGNMNTVSRPYGPSGYYSQPDLKTRSVRNNALRRSPGGEKEAPAGDETALWQASSSSERVQSPSCLWRLVKGVESQQPGPHRRTQTLPPRGAGSQDGAPTLRRHAHSLSDQGPRQQHEDDDAQQQPPEGSEAACGVSGRRRRMASLANPGLVISGSTPSPVLTDKRSTEAKAEHWAEADVAKRRHERREGWSSTPPGGVNANSAKGREERQGDEEGEGEEGEEGGDTGAGINGGFAKDRKAVRGPRMWERLPSRGDGVTGWGEDTVYPCDGNMNRGRHLRTALVESSETDQVVG